MAKEETDKEFKYGVEDLAALMDVAPATVRVWLRNNNVERTGRAYGWNTKAELDALVKQRSEGSAPAPVKVKQRSEGSAPAPVKAKKAAPKAKKATPKAKKDNAEAPSAP